MKAIQPCLEYGNTTICLMADTYWRSSVPDRSQVHACDQQLDSSVNSQEPISGLCSPKGENVLLTSMPQWVILAWEQG